MSEALPPIETDVLDSAGAGGKAIRGAALRASGHLLAMALSLASVPFVIRHLGTVDYGYYMTATSLLFIVGAVTEAGLTQLGQRRYAVLDAGERRVFLQSLVGMRMALTLVGIVLTFVLSAVTGQPGVVVIGTLVAGLGLLLSLTQQTYAVSLSAQLKLGWVTGLELIQQFTLAAGSITLVLLDAPLSAFYWASVVSGAAILLSTVTVLRSENISLRPRFDRERWAAMGREVVPYALASAAGFVYYRVAIVAMSYLSTKHDTGIYAAAQRIVEVVAVMPWLIVTAAFPILARAAVSDAARLRYALQRLFEVSVLIGGAVVVAGVAGARFAIEVVAGPDFDASVPVLQILVASVVFTFVVATMSSALLSLQQYRRILWANLAAVLTTTILSIVLIGPYGAQGAAVATVAAEGTLVVAYLIALRGADRALVPSLAVIPRVLPGAIAAAAVGLALNLPAVLEAPICAAVYVAGAFALRAVPGELISALLRR
jgi:O-antigen/teichoic acid export membrane protein